MQGKRDKPERAAVIEFSSNNLRMVIGEKSGNSVRTLDFLEYPLAIGKDTFASGKVGFGKVNTACNIMRGYIKAAEGYGVSRAETHVIATSALREALNKSYILDQILLKTGLSVNILDGDDEKLYIFKTALRVQDVTGADAALLVFIGSGNVGFAYIREGRVNAYHTVRIGPLRISELFEAVATHTREYHLVVDEFIQSSLNIKAYAGAFGPGKPYALILTGGDVNMLRELCGTNKGGPSVILGRDRLDRTYEYVKDLSPDSISKEFGLPAYRAAVLIPAMCICRSFFQLSGAEEAALPAAYLNESVLYRSLFPLETQNTDKEFYKNTLCSAASLADKYEVDMRHAEFVENASVRIFDKLRKLHGWGAKETTLLQCAAYLHDCGKYIDTKGHAAHSARVVSGLDIIGLNRADINILSRICLMHNDTLKDLDDGLNDKAVTAKLAAILRLADALDKGGLQKFGDISVTLDESELTVHVRADRNADLEKWAFESKGAFFWEVFGIKAVLKVKTVF